MINEKIHLDVESKKNLDDIVNKLFKSSTIGNIKLVINGLEVIKSLGYNIKITKQEN